MRTRLRRGLRICYFVRYLSEETNGRSVDVVVAAAAAAAAASAVGRSEK